MLYAKEIDSVEKEKLVMQKWGNNYDAIYMSGWEEKEFRAKGGGTGFRYEHHGLSMVPGGKVEL